MDQLTIAGEQRVLPDPPMPAATPVYDVVLVTWLLTALSTLCLALVMTGSSLPAYVFVACWIPFTVYHARGLTKALFKSPTIWAYPVLALISTLWSQAAAGTFRGAIELAVTFAFAIIAALYLPPRKLISATLCGLSVVAVVALSVRGFVVDPLTGSVDFVGPFQSKNQLAFFIALLWLTSLAILVDARQHWLFRSLGALSFIASGPLLILARSATSDVTSVAALLVLLINLGFSRLTRTARAIAAFAVTVILLPGIVLLAMLGSELQQDSLALLGKDTTLTGRTVLWERAFELIPEHPWLGQGYHGFWREGYIEAESLWEMFGVHGGFHFHDTLIETTIETGYVGAAILVFFVLSVAFHTLSWSWREKSAEASYFFAIVFLLLVRALVEVDIPSEFSLATFVIVIAAQYSFTYTARSAPVPAAPLRSGNATPQTIEQRDQRGRDHLLGTNSR